MKNRKDCKPLLCDNSLVTGEFDFMDKDRIKNECNCISSNICTAIAELLEKGKIEEAKKLLTNF